MQPNLHVLTRGVLIIDDHILLCKTKTLQTNFYFLPGGHIECGESASAALLRELREEIGYDFVVNRFLGVSEYSFDPQKTIHAKCHTHDYSLLFVISPSWQAARVIHPNVKLKQVEDDINISWLKLSELEHIDIRPQMLKQLLPKWLKADFNHAFYSQMI